MKLGELTDLLQARCNEGHAEDEVGIQILNAFYKIKGIRHINIPINNEKGKDFYFIIPEGDKNDCKLYERR